MKTRVVTLFWGNAWERYGPIFAKPFCDNWHEDIELVIVTDRKLPIGRGKQIILDDVQGYAEFKEHWKDDNKAHGYERPRGEKVDAKGRSWRYDAMMWMPQGLSPRAAMEGMNDGDIFVWLDADVETTRPVPKNWVSSLLGYHDCACLQRQKSHTEIGFYAFKINEKTRKVIDKFAYFYESGEVFNLKEWHSAYVWDRALESVPGLSIRNLSPNGRSCQHVWPNTVLAEYTTHWKGNRKDARK